VRSPEADKSARTTSFETIRHPIMETIQNQGLNLVGVVSAIQIMLGYEWRMPPLFNGLIYGSENRGVLETRVFGVSNREEYDSKPNEVVRGVDSEPEPGSAADVEADIFERAATQRPERAAFRPSGVAFR
jgi:hypothetical protein